MKRALITGITGQDGSYLAEFLLSKGYEVHGVVRRLSADNYERIEHLLGQIHLHQADLLDLTSLIEVMRSTPMAVTSVVYSGISKETLTWLCAARL